MPEDLHQRIHAQVERMFRDGLVEETRRRLECGLAENKTAKQAIGSRQAVEPLRGQRLLPETIELVKTRARQFAKQRMTWFRRQLSVEWIELKPDESPESVSRKIRDLLSYKELNLHDENFGP